jgi:hypothetical protein
MASMLSCAHAGSSTTVALGAILTDSLPSKRARRTALAVTNVRIANYNDLCCLNNVIWGKLQNVILSVHLCHPTFYIWSVYQNILFFIFIFRTVLAKWVVTLD